MSKNSAKLTAECFQKALPSHHKGLKEYENNRTKGVRPPKSITQRRVINLI